MKFKGIDNFRTLAFWSWDGQLTYDRLCSQIEDMHRIGMGGFIIHARSGLSTQYLSEEWFDCVDFCVKEAKKRGMAVWIYDEQGWPSGFVGGKLLKNPDYFAKFLTCNKSQNWQDASFHYVKKADGYDRVFAPIGLVDGKDVEYLHINIEASASNVDILKKEVIDDFISMTHDEYYRQFKDYFTSGDILGFFTDEPQYFRYATPWSDELEKDFISSNLDISEYLPYLFEEDGGEEYRYEYWSRLHNLYIQRFVKRIYEWCEDHGCMLTGHTIEESTLHTQMWCCGGAMDFYAYEHIPGVDHLGRVPGSELEARQVGSMACQMGKKHVLTETFACSGWDVSLRELKNFAETQYVHGVNMMTEHLYHYSFKGMRKRDYPPAFSNQSQWFEEFKAFNEYFAILGEKLSNSQEIADTLVIHPIKSAFLKYRREADDHCVADLDDYIINFMAKANEGGLLYHFGDEGFMAQNAVVKGDKLVVGKREYDKVIFPKIDNIEKTTYDLLTKFAQNGGKLCVMKTPTYISGKKADCQLNGNLSFEDVCKDAQVKVSPSFGIRWTLREQKGQKFLYIVNCLDKDFDLKLTLYGAKNPAIVNILNGEKTGLEPSGEGYILHLDGRASAVVELISNCLAKTLGAPIKVDLKRISDSGNYLLIDKASFSTAGKEFSDKRFIPSIMEELIKAKYLGKIRLKYTFKAEYVPQKLTLIYEDMSESKITLNGESVKGTLGSSLSDEFYSADITNILKKGENVLEFLIDFYQGDDVCRVLYDKDVTESEKNCLLLGTELESVYLHGDFEVKCKKEEECREGVYLVDGDFEIVEPNSNVDFDGKPFFTGRVRYLADLNGLKGRYKVKAVGKFAALNVLLNGKEIDGVQFGDGVEIEVDQNSELVFEAISGNRNIYGPHHLLADPEPLGVGPEAFTMTGSWENGQSAEYRDNYSLVNFGLDYLEFRPVENIKSIHTEEEV